jgi:integrase
LWKAIDCLPEKQGDYLRLIALRGLRKNEGRAVRFCDVDFASGVLTIPETKGKKPHSLPVTVLTRHVLDRRCAGLRPEHY